MLKHCPKCMQDLPLDAFSKDRSKPDGRCHYCKACRKLIRMAPKFRRLALPADYAGDIDCQKCGESKPATWFYLTRTGKRGSYCNTCLAAQRKAWNAAHPGAMNRFTARWRKANPEKQSAAMLNWRTTNPDKAKAATDRWRAEHPVNVATARATRYARVRQAVIRERVILSILYQRDKGICGICHQRVSKKEASRDHIIPLSKGGDHSYANIVLAHKRCNSRKGNRVVVQQMRLF